METTEFEKLADLCLARVADWLEDFDPDEVDFETSDGVITLVFPDGGRFVLNRQGGSHQMWFAAGARAWHYDRQGDTWVDDRDGHDIYANIAEQLGAKLGRTVTPA
jgi:CyaY protein